MRENDYSHVDTKTRLEAEQEEHHQVLQQSIQRQDPNSELQALMQEYLQRTELQTLLHQQRLNQQILQSERLQQIQKQQQLRWQLQEQQIPSNEDGVCAQKFIMFLSHLKQRPADNCITFWSKLVAQHFSLRAKQRLCFSQYQKAVHVLGLLPQDMWQCDLCGAKSGKGVETAYNVLARLFQTKFASGVINSEILHLNHQREYRAPNGLMVLEYREAVQTTVHEQCRVVREGHLRITFSQDLMILSWEFCVRRHEEFLLRRLMAPQVNQLLQVAQKCQNTISQQDIHKNTNMVLGAGQKLENYMKLPSLTNLGYPKKYVRVLQISEVLKSMKDLMDFTCEHNVGPIEGFKRLSEQTAAMGLQRHKMQEMEQSTQAQMNGLTSNNHNNSNNHHQIVGRGAMNGSAQAPAALPCNSNQSPYLSQQRQNSAAGGFTSSLQIQQQHGTMYGAPETLQQNHPHHLQPLHSHGNNQEQQGIEQILKEYYDNARGVQPTASTSSGRNNSFKAASNNNRHMSEELPDDFSVDSFFNDSDSL